MHILLCVRKIFVRLSVNWLLYHIGLQINVHFLSIGLLIGMQRRNSDDCSIYWQFIEAFRRICNRFELVMVSSKRARQIQIEGKDPMVSVDNDKPTVVALREIADGLVTNEILVEKPSVELEEVEEEMAEAVAEHQDDTPTADI